MVEGGYSPKVLGVAGVTVCLDVATYNTAQRMSAATNVCIRVL